MKTKQTTPSKKRKRRMLAAAGIMIALVVALPHIIAKTPLRNVLLSRVGAKDELHLQAERASFGWLSSLRLSGLHLESGKIPVKVDVADVKCSRSWLGIALGLPHLGQVIVESPEIELVFPEGPLPVSKRSPLPITGEFVANNVSFRLLVPDADEPAIALNGMNVAAAIQQTQHGRVLLVEPLTVLDHTPLTPALCDRGLQLAAPLLANSTAIRGEVSLQLDRLRIPLDSQDPAALQTAEIGGTLQLHRVSTSMKDSIFRDVASVVARMVRADLPDTLHVADDTEVRIEMRDGRVYHEGLTFLFPELSPDLAWQTSGWVGLDESLDLIIRVQLPFHLVADTPLLQQLSATPLEVRLTGTLDHPKITFPPDQQWLREAGRMVLGNDARGSAPAIAEAMIDLLQQARERREAAESNGNGAPSLLQRMRERLQQRRDERESTGRKRDQPHPLRESDADAPVNHEPTGLDV